MSLTLHQVIMASKQTKSFYTSLKTTILFEVRILFSQPKRVSSGDGALLVVMKCFFDYSVNMSGSSSRVSALFTSSASKPLRLSTESSLFV